MERMVVTAKGNSLSAKDLPKEVREAKSLPVAGKKALSRNAAEKENIQRAMVEAKGNKSKASKLLGVTRKTLFNQIKKYGLE
jgi:transcriptional regulator of acetoin/glycerol metabolism